MARISRLYTTSSRGSSIGSALLKSRHPGYNKVFANNMDYNSFTGTSKGIAKVLAESKKAFMNVEDIFLSFLVIGTREGISVPSLVVY